MAKLQFSRKDEKAMFDAVRNSMVFNREILIPVCGSLKKPYLETTSTCMGNACSVALETCKHGKTIGYFHTHPHSRPILTDTDLLAGICDGGLVAGVGGNDKAPMMALVGSADEIAPPKNLTIRFQMIRNPGGKEHQEMVEECKVIPPKESVPSEQLGDWYRSLDRLKEISRRLYGPAMVIRENQR